MKRTLALLLLGLSLGAAGAVAQQGKRHDPNPKKDPDVQRGYDKHQKETKEKRENEKNKENNEKYTVHKSGEGQGGCPTSCGTPPHH